MSLEANKDLIRAFVDEVMNAGNITAIAETFVASAMLAGGLGGQITVIKTAFPDSQFTIDELIAEDNKVAVRMTMRGTHIGILAGLPAFGRFETPVHPTDATVNITMDYIFTVSTAKIVSFSAEVDQIGLLRQLGWTFTQPNPS